MLIRRCAWHREFYGYSLVHGVASWRGFSVRFTDGVCRHCAARVRAEWHLARPDAQASRRRLFQVGYRRVALVVGFAVVIIAALPAKAIIDAMLSKGPAGGRSVATTGEPPEVAEPSPAAPAVALASAEAAPRLTSRQRPTPVPEPVVVRYFPPKPMGPTWSAAKDPVFTPEPTALRAAEPTRPEPARPAPTASADAGVASISRTRATEDELMRVARVHSTARLLLAPPEEHPRHAGLAIQTP